jgi:hypothetical protein
MYNNNKNKKNRHSYALTVRGPWKNEKMKYGSLNNENSFHFSNICLSVFHFLIFQNGSSFFILHLA